MKKLTIVWGLAMILILAATMAVEASPPKYFYLEKVCGETTCEIQNSTVPELNGGIISYNYHMSDEEKLFLSAQVDIDVDGGSAVGHFVFLGDHGYFTIQGGSGVLEGFHAQGTIGWIEGTATFPLEGTYHFD